MRALSMSALSHRPSATCFSLHFDPLRTPSPFLCSAKFSVPARNLRNVSLSLPLPLQPLKLSRGSSFVSCAASQEEQKHSEVEVEKVKNELDLQADESQEAWKQTLESVREQALKMQTMSQEAYDAYSKKAGLILTKTSHQLKIQAENARHDLGVVAKEITEEGKGYISTIVEKSPEPVKEIVETFSSSTTELNHLSDVRDFYIGIPYGVFLSVGGFLSFMLTGSISAIRFGVILGGTLLALSILSLRSWKGGESSTLNLKGQAAIALVIFIRELRFLSQRASLPTSLLTLISGTMVIFYAYRIWLDGEKFGSSLEQQSED